MSNLTDLLPAGAGGKQVDFVASGTIGNGVTVGLNSDGTVTAVAETAISDSTGAGNQFTGTADADIAAAWHPTANKIVITYYDTSAGEGKAVVGTVSGTSISFGSAVSIVPSGRYPVAIVYDPVNDLFVVAYIGGSQGITSVSISGTTVTWDGTYNNYDPLGAPKAYNVSLTWDSTNSVVVISYCNVYSRLNIRTVDMSGPYTFGTSTQPYGTSTAADNLVFTVYVSSVDRHLCFFDNNSLSDLRYTILQITGSSGSNVSYTTPATLSGFYTQQRSFAAAYDDVNDWVMLNTRQNSTLYGLAQALRISTSAITATSTATVYASYQANFQGGLYNPDAGKFFLSYQDDRSSGTTPREMLGLSVNAITASAGLTFTTPFNIGNSSAQERNGCVSNDAIVYDPVDKRIIGSFQDYTSSPHEGRSYVITQAYNQTNNTDFIGITDAAISDTASGSVTIKGGISTKVTGLTPNATYYVQADGTLSTTASDVLAGKALSSTSINLDYTT